MGFFLGGGGIRVILYTVTLTPFNNILLDEYFHKCIVRSHCPSILFMLTTYQDIWRLITISSIKCSKNTLVYGTLVENADQIEIVFVLIKIRRVV